MVLVICTYVNDKILFSVLAFLLREARETYFKSNLRAHMPNMHLQKQLGRFNKLPILCIACTD